MASRAGTSPRTGEDGIEKQLAAELGLCFRVRILLGEGNFGRATIALARCGTLRRRRAGDRRRSPQQQERRAEEAANSPIHFHLLAAPLRVSMRGSERPRGWFRKRRAAPTPAV